MKFNDIIDNIWNNENIKQNNKSKTPNKDNINKKEVKKEIPIKEKEKEIPFKKEDKKLDIEKKEISTKKNNILDILKTNKKEEKKDTKENVKTDNIIKKDTKENAKEKSIENNKKTDILDLIKKPDKNKPKIEVNKEVENKEVKQEIKKEKTDILSWLLWWVKKKETNKQEVNKETKKENSFSSNFLNVKKQLFNKVKNNKKQVNNYKNIIYWIVIIIIIWIFWYAIYQKYNVINNWSQEITKVKQIIKNNKNTTNLIKNKISINKTNTKNNTNNNIETMLKEYWVIYRINKKTWDIKIIKNKNKLNDKKLLLLIKKWEKLKQGDKTVTIYLSDKWYKINLKDKMITKVFELNYLNFKLYTNFIKRKKIIKEKMEEMKQQISLWVWDLQVMKAKYRNYNFVLFKIQQALPKISNNLIKTILDIKIPLKTFLATKK